MSIRKIRRLTNKKEAEKPFAESVPESPFSEKTGVLSIVQRITEKICLGSA